MKKPIDKVEKYTISSKVNNVLNTYKRQFTISMHDLLINSLVLLY